MSFNHLPKVAIVDYGLGNLHSVARACELAGMSPSITSSVEEVLSADGVILPGVGAFGDAMQNLRRLDLVQPLRDCADSGTPLFGVCLGLQLLMSRSEEFGSHEGLDIIPGSVVHLGRPQVTDRVLKVPQVCWNRVYRSLASHAASAIDVWPLSGMSDGTYMYFVHSFYVRPDNPQHVAAVTRYGDVEFCSAVRNRNVCAVQFHPERSGPGGIQIYRNLANLIGQKLSEKRYAA